ncbi:MAG TPA: hypothetical protein PKY87_12790 [Terricaulis sp.]|nr:hypothetical protein [Terricaulis sp.]
MELDANGGVKITGRLDSARPAGPGRGEDGEIDAEAELAACRAEIAKATPTRS